MPATSNVSLSSNPYINGLLGGQRWVPTALTYSFPTNVTFYGTDFDFIGPITNFEVLNATQVAAVQSIFAAVSSFANLSFSTVTETATTHGDLRFGMSDIAAPTAWAMLPNPFASGGDSFYKNTGATYDNPVRGNYAWDTFVHEIGHALGLKHPHEVTSFGTIPVDRDSKEFTIMSYRSHIGSSVTTGLTNETWGFTQTFMMYDVAALQYMYGANYGFNATATTYQWNPSTGAMSINGVAQSAPGGNRVFMTLWDGGGVDTYDLSNYTGNVTIDLRPGEWTTTSAIQLANLGGGFYARGNIANSLLVNGDTRSLIENAKGGPGADILIGNIVANVLDGGGGTDIVYLAGLRTDYAFSGTLLNFSATGFGVTDTLLNVESVRFLGSGETVAASTLLTTTPPPSGDDYRDSIADTTAPLGTIAVGGTRQGSIESDGDTDVFSISLSAGQTYTFQARGSASGGGTLTDPMLELRNASGTLLASNDDAPGTTDSLISFTASTSGTYYLVADGYLALTGSYTLSAVANSVTVADDFRDSTTDTTAALGLLRLGRTTRGNIESDGDTDVFSLRLTAAVTYTFTVKGAASGSGTLADPMIELRNRSGTILAANDDWNGGADARITFTPTVSGVYYVVADGDGSGTGTYLVSAVRGNPAAAPAQGGPAASTPDIDFAPAISPVPPDLVVPDFAALVANLDGSRAVGDYFM